MTDDPYVPLPARPAATVMLVRELRENPAGIAVFLMRRHAAMEFAAGTVVFPGGGVDDRDRNADIAWAGPPPAWWAQRFGIDNGLAEALVCAAARETFEECGVLFAGPADDPGAIVGDASVYRESRQALADRTLSFADFLRRENLVLRADLLRPWANWVTPQAAIAEFEAGRCFLLPPTWTQLDSLNGRTVADVLAVERQIVTVQPNLEIDGDNWIFEFFDSDRYHRARKAGGLGWRI